jgi:hypothetical protein
MLEIQRQLLSGKTPEEICEPLGIKIRRKDHKVLFSYDQIDSMKFKTHPIVKECRGLILYEDNWDICSMGFRRFLNYGEDGADELPADLGGCYVLEKLDGTYVSAYFDRNDRTWHCSTRSMIDAEGPVNDMSSMTFADLFWEAMKNTKFAAVPIPFSTEMTFIFELTSPHNRIVTKYDDTHATLLTARSNNCECEFSRKTVEVFASMLECPVVKAVDARNWEELLKMENADGSKKDPQFEGYVIVKEGLPSHLRVKMKNPSYVALHKTATSMSERNLVELIKKGLQDDFLAQFPEYTPNVDRVINGLRAIESELREDWVDLYGVEDRKAFALIAKTKKLPHYLFAIKDGHTRGKTMREFLMEQRTDALLESIQRVMPKESKS